MPVAAVKVQLRERQLRRRHVELGADAIQRRAGGFEQGCRVREPPRTRRDDPLGALGDPDTPRIVGRGPSRGRAGDELVRFGEPALVGEDLGDVGVDERDVHRVAVLRPGDPARARTNRAPPPSGRRSTPPRRAGSTPSPHRRDRPAACRPRARPRFAASRGLGPTASSAKSSTSRPRARASSSPAISARATPSRAATIARANNPWLARIAASQTRSCARSRSAAGLTTPSRVRSAAVDGADGFGSTGPGVRRRTPPSAAPGPSPSRRPRGASGSRRRPTRDSAYIPPRSCTSPSASRTTTRSSSGTSPRLRAASNARTYNFAASTFA